MSLALKLPYTHPFAGGYPRVGGQPLPSDPDAIDYLERVKAADGGAAVEVGVAMAVDQFIKGCKADSAGYAGDPTRTVWDALQASCIMCGARTLAGALVPLKGASPTNVANNFASGDYDRSSGLKGDGSTKYLDSNRANDADGQDDQHLSVHLTQNPGGRVSVHAGVGLSTSPSATYLLTNSSDDAFFRCRSVSSGQVVIGTPQDGFFGMSRESVSQFSSRVADSTTVFEFASETPLSANIFIFSRTDNLTRSDARLAFYSIGSSLDLAALDNRVSTLVSAIAAAL